MLFGSSRALGALVLLGSAALYAQATVGCSASGENTDGAGNSGTGAGSGTGNSGTGADGVGGLIGAGGDDDGTCAAETFAGELVPLDLHVVLDRSASMQDGNKWGAVISALQGFINDPSSAGVGMGIQYFPVNATGPIPNNCNSDADCGFYGPCIPIANICNGSVSSDSCDPADYQTPVVQIVDIGTNAAALNSSLSSNSPNGDSTPSQPAMEGAVAYASAWAAANPTHVTVIILATDGEPTNCNPNSVGGTAAAAAAAAAGNPSVQTFVVGVGSNLTDLNQIAQAGGTGNAYLVDTGGNVTQQFIDALNEIRATGACQFQIPLPTSGVPDFNKVNVEVVNPNDPNNPTTLVNVGDESGCGAAGGWYYDNPNNPNVIYLCDSSCTAVENSDDDVAVSLGCATVVN